MLHRIVSEQRQVTGPAPRRNAGGHRGEQLGSALADQAVQVWGICDLEFSATFLVADAAESVCDQENDLRFTLSEKWLQVHGSVAP